MSRGKGDDIVFYDKCCVCPRDIEIYLSAVFLCLAAALPHHNSDTDFDVNIYLKKTCQKGIIKNDPTIIKSTIKALNNNLVIYYISSSIYRVSVGINYNRLIKFARETFYIG